MFWKIIIAAAALLAIAWVAYFLWEWRQDQIEKKLPKQRSERYQQATNSVADYAKKLAEFKKPTYKRPDDSEQPKP